MNNIVTINTTELAVKEYKGQRVVTFKEIDEVHQRPAGTAGRNFRSNKDHFIEGTDYFVVDLTDDEIRRQFGAGKNAGRTITVVTESGYLMLVKSFTDDLAWKVQRQLVNSYFRVKSTSATKTIAPGAEKRAKAMLLNAKSRAAKQLMQLWDAAGIKPEYQALALGDYYREDGIQLPAIALQSTKVTYDKTTIADKLGILSKTGNPHAQAVGAIIAKLNDITDDEIERVPYCRNGHDGFDYQFTESVINKVSGWLNRNDYPTQIVSPDKIYQVRYR